MDIIDKISTRRAIAYSRSRDGKEISKEQAFEDGFLDAARLLCRKVSIVEDNGKPDGIWIPIINRTLELRDAGSGSMSFSMAKKLAMEAGISLPTVRETFILNYYAQDIARLLADIGGEQLWHGEYWTCQRYDNLGCSAFSYNHAQRKCTINNCNKYFKVRGLKNE